MLLYAYIAVTELRPRTSARFATWCASAQVMRRILVGLVFSIIAIPGGSFSRALHAERISGTAPVGPGGVYRMYYEVEGTGEPIMFLHGYTLDHRMWDAQCESLAAEHQVIRCDLIGHGLSSGLFGTVRDWETVRDLLNYLGVERAHVVGLSFGVSVALDFAFSFPERTRSVVAMDGFPGDYQWYSTPGEFIDRMLSYQNTARSQGLRVGLNRWTADRLFGPAMALPDVRPRLGEIILQGHTAVGAGAAFFRQDWPVPAGFSLASIRAPTLIVVGELDLPDFQRAGNIMLSGIPGAQRVIVAGAGHMVPMEKPVEANQILAHFISPVPEPSSGVMLLALLAGIAAWGHRTFRRDIVRRSQRRSMHAGRSAVRVSAAKLQGPGCP